MWWKLLVPALQMILGAGAARAALRRLGLVLTLLLVALLLILAAFGFGLYAAYGYLATLMPAPAAAAVCAGGLLLVATIVVATALWRPRTARPARSGTGPSLHGMVDEVTGWVRANPAEATTAALLLGLVVGARR
jgi:hypothetical protein